MLMACGAMKLLAFYGLVEMGFMDIRNIIVVNDFFKIELFIQRMAVGSGATGIVDPGLLPHLGTTCGQV